MNEEGIVMAYIGPGAGLASIGPLLTLLGAVGLMVLGFIMVSSEVRDSEVEGAAGR